MGGDADDLDKLKHEVQGIRFQVSHHDVVLERIEQTQAQLSESMAQFLVYEHKHQDVVETLKRVFKRLESLEHRQASLQEQRLGPRIKALEQSVQSVPLNDYFRSWIERIMLLATGAVITFVLTNLPSFIGAA